MWYFVFGLIFSSSAYCSYNIDKLHPMHRPQWALTTNGKLFFALNGVISLIAYIGVSIWAIEDQGILIVIGCTIILFPFLTSVLRAIFGDPIISYLAIPAYLILIIIIT